MIYSKAGYLAKDIKVNYEMFDYLQEIVETNRSRPHRHNDDTINDRSFDKSWTGVRSYKEAEEMALHGWSEKQDDVLRQVFAVKGTKDEDKLVKFKNDVVGYAPIIPLALQRVPNSMLNVDKKRVKSKIIHIVYNISVTCGTSGDTILETGLKLFKAIMALERAGYRVKLTAVQDFSGDGDMDLMVLNLKDEFRPIDVSTTMFPLFHPAMFRAIGFAWYERSPVTKQRSCYGTSAQRCYPREKIEEAIMDIMKTKAKYIWLEDIEYLNDDEVLELVKNS